MPDAENLDRNAEGDDAAGQVGDAVPTGLTEPLDEIPPTGTAELVEDGSKRGVGLVFDDRYLYHNTGLALIERRDPYPFPDPVPHVSSPVQVGRAKQLMDLAGLTDRMVRIDAFEAGDDVLSAYHTADYIARVGELALTGGDAGEGAPLGRGGDRIARLAVGGVMGAVDAVMTGRVGSAYALVRPPGHHAMADRGMGFCVFNNVVLAARHAQRIYGADKVLILDWDVHHGNGTQDAFYDDPTVLFISLHQEDLYPVGWGAVDHLGRGLGEGFTVNVPLPAGTGNRGYLEAFDRIVLPIARQFAPDLVIVSAGQDANVLDPLGRMSLTTSAYRDMTSLIRQVAAESCGGRLVVAQEGGYAATYSPYCSAAIAEALVGPQPNVTPIEEPYGARAGTMPPSRVLGLDADRALDRAVTVLRRHWSL
jgi:acetoin utilization deacetylase AcuC-like enzyme